MTGRDLVIYILANDLEDEPLFTDGKFIGSMSLSEAAAKFDVGVETIKVWSDAGYLDAIRIGNEIFIPIDAKKPTFDRKEKSDNA